MTEDTATPANIEINAVTGLKYPVQRPTDLLKQRVSLLDDPLAELGKLR